MAYKVGALNTKERKEWASIRAKGKRHGISVKRSGYATVYPDGIRVQLGTGRATEVMDARIKVKKRRG